MYNRGIEEIRSKTYPQPEISNSFWQKIKAKKQVLGTLFLLVLVMVSSFVYIGQTKEGEIKFIESNSSSDGSNNSEKVIEKIYIKNVDNVSFKYDNQTVKVQDGRLECIKDDRILQWHEGLEEWECNKPTSSVFGDLDRNSVKVNGGGHLECKNNGDVLYWDGKKDQWACQSKTAGLSGGEGITEDDGEFSIDSPTCSGNDKLQWNGSSFVCSADMDTNTDQQTLSFNTGTQNLSISNGNSVDLSSLIKEHNELSGLQGGVANEYYHLTEGEHNDVTNFFNTFSLPNIDGSDGQVLKTDGNGNVSWQDDVDTDDQTLSFDSGTSELSISEGNSVDLSDLVTGLEHNSLSGLQGGTTDEYYHLTFSQQSNLTGFADVLTLPTIDGTSGQVLKTDGSGVLSWFDDTDTNTDEQTLSFNSGTNELSISNGNTIDLSSIDTDTDDQTLSFNSGTGELSIADGNTVDLSSLSGGTDDHNALTNLQGGTTDEYYHLTSTQHSNLTGFANVIALPSADGTSGQVLKTDGSGNLTWQNEGAGTSFFTRDSGNGYLYPATLADDLGFGINSPSARVHIEGETSDDTTYALKVVNSSDTNLLSIRDDGRIDMYGDMFFANGMYKDWNFPVTTLASGGGVNPDIINLASTTIKVASFDGGSTTEEVGGSIEIDHDYKEGTDIIPHIHWYPITDVAGTVAWKLEYTILRNGDIAGSSTTIEVDTDTNSLAWEQLISSFPAINGTNLKIGDQIMFRFYRDPADSDDDYNGTGNDAAAATLGFHYQADSLGSRQVSTK